MGESWMQWSLCIRPRSRLSHTDRLSSVDKMFIIWRKQEQFNSFNVTGFVLTDILLTNGDEPNLILSKFTRPLYFFISSAFWRLDEKSQWLCILVCNFFTSKHYRSWCWSRFSRSRWENLDCGHYPFQPFKFVHLVVPSPCKTEPYNKTLCYIAGIFPATAHPFIG